MQVNAIKSLSRLTDVTMGLLALSALLVVITTAFEILPRGAIPFLKADFLWSSLFFSAALAFLSFALTLIVALRWWILRTLGEFED